jgi:hypothetical protein
MYGNAVAGVTTVTGVFDPGGRKMSPYASQSAGLAEASYMSFLSRFNVFS